MSTAAASPQYKALVLAAGLGTRLKPLTDHYPKPSMPIMGVPLLHLSVWRLQQAGLAQFAMNTHHLAGIIRTCMAQYPDANLKVHYSHEPKILGTGGAMRALDAWRGRDHLAVFSGDIVSDIDFKKIKSVFESTKATAVVSALDGQRPGTNPIYVHSDQLVGIEGVASIGQGEARTYANAQLARAEMFDPLPKGEEVSVWPAYKYCFEHQLKVPAVTHSGFWHDIGTPKAYWQVHEDFLERSPADFFKLCQTLGIEALLKAQNLPLQFVPKGEIKKWGAATIVGPSVVVARAAPKAKIQIGPYAVVHGDAEFGADGVLEKTMVFGGARSEAAEKLVGWIVTPQLRLKWQ